MIIIDIHVLKDTEVVGGLITACSQISMVFIVTIHKFLTLWVSHGILGGVIIIHARARK